LYDAVVMYTMDEQSAAREQYISRGSFKWGLSTNFDEKIAVSNIYYGYQHCAPLKTVQLLIISNKI
jgi:hypothetical protein